MKPNAPLYNAVKSYATVKARFHTPGHCGKNLDGFLYSNALADITELSFSDNLQCPDGVIGQAEKMCARRYGSRDCLFFSGGATQALFTALSAARQFCDRLYVLGDAHKSVYAGATIAGLAVERFDDAKKIAAALVRRPAAALITSPDYYGVCADAEAIGAVLKKARLSIVDEAHGPHFVYSELFPESLASAADMCVSSFHKTLPVFTGGAALHVNREDCRQACIFYRSRLAGTSPSYVTLASIDFARAYTEKFGARLYKKTYDAVQIAKKRIHRAGFETLKNDDFSRLVILCDQSEKLGAHLEKKGVFAESATSGRVCFIVTPYNYKNLAAVVSALKSFETKGEERLSPPVCAASVSKSRRVEYVALSVAEGRILATELAVYPPGTPFAFEGCAADAALIAYIRKYESSVAGLVNGKLAVYTEEL